MHPHFEIVLWGEQEVEALITRIDPDFLSVYRSYPYDIQRVDACRSFILYAFGGVYTDLDTTPKLPVENILKLYEADTKVEVLLGESANVDKASNYFMASAKGAPFWLKIIEAMKKRAGARKLGRHQTIMFSTGPILVSDIAEEFPHSVQIVPRAIVNSCDVCQACQSPFGYISDQHASSWAGKDSQVLKRLYCATRDMRKIPYYVWLSLMTIAVLLAMVLLLFLAKCRQKCAR